MYLLRVISAHALIYQNLGNPIIFHLSVVLTIALLKKARRLI